MRFFKYLIPLAGTLVLVACDQSEPPSRPETGAKPAVELPETSGRLSSKEGTEVPNTKLNESNAAEKNQTQKASEQGASANQDNPPDKAKAKVADVTLKPKTVTGRAQPALDLNLNPNVFDPLQVSSPSMEGEKDLLPPLFDEKVEKESSFQINGKLITNEYQRGDYWDTVEGAQLNFEFKQ